MDEHMETMEMSQEQVDAAWDDGAADQPAAEQPPATEPETPPDPPASEGKEEDPKPADQPETFTLKNRDEMRQVTKEELVSMAQKGWDYDKVREERDQLRRYRQEADPALELVKSYAQRNGMSVSDYLDFCRRQELMAGGMTQQAAEQKIGMEKERAELDRQKAEIQAAQREQDSMKQAAQQAAAARQKDIQDFYRAYPDVDPKTIPQEVWAQVQKGETLTNAYTRHENQRLQAEIAALKQNEKNKQQSTGSLGGVSGAEMDEIDRLWAEDD